jgi:HTH-type transcriptional regulator, transcriptional repressor of NAD biosynthesis genes
MKKKTGMVLGKFLPPHKGHLYLAEFAANFVDTLYIVVGTLECEPISRELRYQWMQQLLPNCIVLHLKDENPQDPSEHPDFWDIWKNSLQSILPEQPDLVFASEDYGYKLAEILNAQFIPVDLNRNNLAVSGTDIRNSPHENWQFIPWPVRDYYLKRVCIFGPESSGKSTLAKSLAKEFNTIHVPEFARTYLEEKNGELLKSDMPVIALGQASSEESLARYGKSVLFCDTDILTTKIWSEYLYQEVEPWIEEQAQNDRYDLYLLCDIDVPWVEDIVRYLPEERKAFFQKCEDELQRLNKPYVKISGDWSQRLSLAKETVNQIIDASPSKAYQ